MIYEGISEIKVSINFTGTSISVGRLALKDKQIYFEYNHSFIATNLELSPLKLPL